VNPEFQPLADAIYRERVLRARRVPPEQRILEGPQLFDFACSASLAGLRMQMPNATEAELRQGLRRRLAIGRKLQNHRA
jgi:hypothetical protein